MADSNDTGGAGNGLSSEFLARLVHQLRTPLNVVLGYGDLMLSGERAGWSEEDRGSLDAMLRGARRMLHILDDVGTWTALQSGMPDLPCEPVDLTRILADLDAEGIDPDGRLRSELAADEPWSVAAVPGQLQQVLRSVAVHALAADTGDGPVAVRATRLPAGRIAVDFAHAGSAISAAMGATLFLPFARVRAGDHGTGLGLAIAEELSRRMGGALSYLAAPNGAGGTFRVELPGVDTPREPQAARPAAPATAGPLRVLYVEDVAANRELVGRILRAMTDMSVEFAESAEEGLARVRAAAPDIILMDINLPGMDGFEALRHLKADPKTRHIPVIALTAAAHPDDVAQGRRAPFAAYLTKPIDAIALVDTLKTARPAGQAAAESPER